MEMDGTKRAIGIAVKRVERWPNVTAMTNVVVGSITGVVGLVKIQCWRDL